MPRSTWPPGQGKAPAAVAGAVGRVPTREGYLGYVACAIQKIKVGRCSCGGMRTHEERLTIAAPRESVYAAIADPRPGPRPELTSGSGGG